MQNLIYKILWALGLIIIPALSPAQSSDAAADLRLADSLFAAEKYTESLELYQHVLQDRQQYTPGMLLKMAFIKEGLGDYSEALYFLNLFYTKTSDKRALRKMEELARQHELQGYQFTDMEFFQTVYRRFYLHIILALFALSLFTFSFILWRKRRHGYRPVGGGIAFVLILGVLFALINFGQGREKAIIVTEQAYIRDAPSSGADVAGFIGKGNRVEIYGRNDVWVKIKWDNRPVYIRESHLAVIES